MHDPFTSLPEPVTVDNDPSRHPIPGQLELPGFTSTAWHPDEVELMAQEVIDSVV